MWDYAVVTGVTPANYHETVRRYEQDNFSLHESNHYRIPPATHRSLGSAQSESRWDLVFRRASKDTSHAQMIINRYGFKLKEVADVLGGMRDAACIRLSDDIKECLHKGSPDDM